MDIRKGVGYNGCIELVEKGCMCAIMLEKVMFWWEIWVVQNYNRCGMTDGIGAEHMHYVQVQLLWIN